MEARLCEDAGSSQQCSETVLEAKCVEVQRLQQCTASIQVPHREAEAMGRYFDALLSAVWELRHGHEHDNADTGMQSVL